MAIVWEYLAFWREVSMKMEMDNWDAEAQRNYEFVAILNKETPPTHKLLTIPRGAVTGSRRRYKTPRWLTWPKFTLWFLRNQNGITNRTATESSSLPQKPLQTRHPAIYQQPQFSFHPPTTTSALELRHSASAPVKFLLAKPENAHVRSLRVPDCTEPISPTSPQDNIHECCATVKASEQQSQSKSPIMGLSKTWRISILLAIDTAFFFVELIVGYAVHSLALVADAFHMLNDVLSLCVGLWAVKRAKAGRTTMYTYGWQRAETLGALVNGVFLVALCMSIFLEAIQRFVEPQIVTNPVMVLIVGCLGLASNIIGLFLFHDHGHSHGEEGQSHGNNPIRSAEEGHVHTSEHVSWADESTRLMDDHGGSIEDVLPSVRVAGFEGSTERRDFSRSDETNTTTHTITDQTSAYKRRSTGAADKHRRRSSFFTGSIEDMPVHPVGRRDEIINASQYEPDEQSLATEDEDNETQPLTQNDAKNGQDKNYGSIQPNQSTQYSHAEHKHRKPREKTSGGGGGHGHSHGDLNMRGVFLHVLGDALGNVGVIATALIIWLAEFPQRYYFDPAISLLITVIILWSAIPLCKAASRILLQAVPMGMSIDEIKADIEDLEGVMSAHHIHVWQLSDTKLVASLHVRIAPSIKDPGSEGYMRLAREIQLCLKEYGIRSSTIQPEFECGITESSHSQSGSRANGSAAHTSDAQRAVSLGSKDVVCMLDSEDAGAVQGQEDDHNHEHNSNHDHSHDNHDHAHDHKNGKQKHNHQQ